MPTPAQNNHHKAFTQADFLSLLGGIGGCSGAVIAGMESDTTTIFICWGVGLMIGGSGFFCMNRMLGWAIRRIEKFNQRLNLMMGWILLLLSVAAIAGTSVSAYWVIKIFISWQAM